MQAAGLRTGFLWRAPSATPRALCQNGVTKSLSMDIDLNGVNHKKYDTYQVSNIRIPTVHILVYNIDIDLDKTAASAAMLLAHPGLGTGGTLRQTSSEARLKLRSQC